MKRAFLIIALLLLFMNEGDLFADIGQYEPSLQEVQQIAIRYARLEPEEITKWRKRSRLSALLPRLQVGFDKDMKNNVDVNVSDSVSVTSSGVNIGPEANDITQISDLNTGFEVKALWYLDKLVFNETQLDISSEARFLVSERRQILKEVNQKYYDRLAIIDEISQLAKKPGNEDAIKTKKLLIKRSEADLDALTGGWFTRQINTYQ